MKNLILFTIILFLCISCSNTNDLPSLDSLRVDDIARVSRSSNSDEEQCCKKNLEAFAEAFSTVLLENEDVVRLINSRINIRREEYLPDRVFVTDLLQEDNETLNNFFSKVCDVFKELPIKSTFREIKNHM